MAYIKKKSSSDTSKKSRQKSITSYTIFKDRPTSNNEQITSTPEKKNNIKLSDKEVQCSPQLWTPDAIVDMKTLTDDAPSEEYWKSLATERQKALNDTLEENKSLCELIDVRSKEVDELAEENAILTEENGLLKQKAENIEVLETIISELATSD